VGDGSQKGYLQDLARELGVADRVHFLGNRADVHDIMRQFDVGLQMTRGPNLGLVTLEMLASGVPVVIAVRDPEEVLMAEDTLLNGGGGLVADAAPKAIAAAVERLLHESGTDGGEYRRRARATAEIYYDWEHHVDAVRRVYQEVIGGASGSAPA
jgi:glycosyltransferase involved in cell wall biosynthesis